MGGNDFRFKRFTVGQEGCAMKVGTDGVLLGAWCEILPQDKLLLDIGAGSGVIALQLAQRTETWHSVVEAVEIDEPSCERARENFRESEWAARLQLHCSSVQDFARNAVQNSFDHIVSNPPYFADSLTPPDAARAQARHTGKLSYDELLDCCAALLKPVGRLSLILPAAESGAMTAKALSRGLWPSRRTEVWSTPKSGPKRVLMEFSRREAAAGTPSEMLTKTPSETLTETSSETLNETTIATAAGMSVETSVLVIGGAEPGSFSDEYRALTRDFYLYF